MHLNQVDDDNDSWVTYGNAFSDDESAESRTRALLFGSRRSIPAAYDQRVLNEKGRPMRFHGAFTGGFSAGYFNTVGSKAGFQPKTFYSSRKTRQRDAEEEKAATRPEDFMDDEDFGEFGIAPRRIKLSHEFDDTHIRDALKTGLGGQSVIPGSGDLLKNLIVPCKGPLADRLLRRMGWRETDGQWEVKQPNDYTKGETLKPEGPEDTETVGNLPHVTKSPVPFHMDFRFEAKVNTFGLGYSGLNPDIAMGRQRTSESSPHWGQTYAGDRHPEESATAFLQRQQQFHLQSSGFNPLGGSLRRSGIRGQAFGVGALETDDADIYSQDRLTDYDWEIGAGAEDELGSEEDDEEEAEMEAARLGRLSSLSHDNRRSSRSLRGRRTIDGWTAPRESQERKVKPGHQKTGTLPGFTPSSAYASTLFEDSVLRLPPGYMPVFNPLCVRSPSESVSQHRQTSTSEQSVSEAPKVKYTRMDAISRSRLLEDTDSVFNMVTPVDQLRIEAAAAGLPVPAQVAIMPTQSDSSTAAPAAVTTSSSSLPFSCLLKTFKNDPAKQSRFEAFQVLVRRGFTDEVAYVRCSGGVELSAEDRDQELSAFQTAMRTSRTDSMDQTVGTRQHAAASTAVSDKGKQLPSTAAPLSSRLAPHKQQLVASLLASRFRSAGCMDISKEVTEDEARARRAAVESLETVEPKDHAVATETYGAMTRRRLTWNPDKLLCKRINVPDPHPESTFVGCPDEHRLRNPFTRRGRRRLLDIIGGRGSSSTEFSLFDLLDVNRGLSDEIGENADDDNDNDEVQELETVPTQDPSTLFCPEPSTDLLKNPHDTSSHLPSNRHLVGRGAALFACLFDAVEEARPSVHEVQSGDVVNPSVSPGADATLKPDESRVLGPALPLSSSGSTPLDEPPLPDRPPLDLFKSIFASDEELSDSNPSELEDEGITESSPPAKWPNSSDASEMTLLKHLFHTNEDEGAPLATLSRIASSQPSTSASSAQPPPALTPDSNSCLHGPDLPPNYHQDMPPLDCSSTTRALHRTDQPPKHQPFDSPTLQWVEGTLLSPTPKKSGSRHVNRKHKQKKHSRSLSKHKRHRRADEKLTKRLKTKKKKVISSDTDSSSSSSDES